MEQRNRVQWWDKRTGSHYIGDLTPQGWDFGEREYGGVRWYTLTPTKQLVQTADRLLRECENANAGPKLVTLNHGGTAEPVQGPAARREKVA